jgi:hypothetical protein
MNAPINPVRMRPVQSMALGVVDDDFRGSEAS